MGSPLNPGGGERAKKIFPRNSFSRHFVPITYGITSVFVALIVDNEHKPFLFLAMQKIT